MTEFFRDWRRWTLHVAWMNLRWRVGYAIGGFTSAYRRTNG